MSVTPFTRTLPHRRGRRETQFPPPARREGDQGGGRPGLEKRLSTRNATVASAAPKRAATWAMAPSTPTLLPRRGRRVAHSSPSRPAGGGSRGRVPFGRASATGAPRYVQNPLPERKTGSFHHPPPFKGEEGVAIRLAKARDPVAPDPFPALIPSRALGARNGTYRGLHLHLLRFAPALASDCNRRSFLSRLSRPQDRRAS